MTPLGDGGGGIDWKKMTDGCEKQSLIIHFCCGFFYLQPFLLVSFILLATSFLFLFARSLFRPTFTVVWVNVRLCLSLLQEALSWALSGHCGCSHFQRLPPEQRPLTCLLFTLLFLPILTLHHQRLLLSQTESPAPRGAFYSTLAQKQIPPSALRWNSPSPNSSWKASEGWDDQYSH